MDLQKLILVHGYDKDNYDLNSYDTKIMIATQNFIYDTKRFCSKKNPPPPPLPTPPPVPPSPPPRIPLSRRRPPPPDPT